MKKRIILFFVFILLVILASAIFIINDSKSKTEQDKIKKFCYDYQGYTGYGQQDACLFLYGDSLEAYSVNLENKCFNCLGEKCLYNNILETKGVLCK